MSMKTEIKPLLLVTAEAFDEDGNHLGTAKGSNTLTGHGLDWLLNCMISSATFAAGANMVLSAAANGSNPLQRVDSLRFQQGTNPGYTASFGRTSAALAGINYAVMRQGSNALASVAMTGLTHTSTTGTSPFVSNAAKSAASTWLITWKIAVNITAMTGLTANERGTIGDIFERFATSADYIDSDNYQLAAELIRSAPQPIDFRPTRSQQSRNLSIDIAANTVTAEVVTPGPRPDLQGRRLFVPQLVLNQSGGRLPLLLAKSTGQVDVGTSAAGGTLTLVITFS